MKKAKLKAANARNDDPEPEYLKIEIPFTNVIENIKQTSKLYDAKIVEGMLAPPRPDPNSLGNRKGLRTPWNFSLSVFRDYKSDNPKLLANCFERDWANCKIGKIIKNEDEELKVKEIYAKNYELFRESYKYYAGVSPQDSLMAIGLTTMT